MLKDMNYLILQFPKNNRLNLVQYLQIAGPQNESYNVLMNCTAFETKVRYISKRRTIGFIFTLESDTSSSLYTPSGIELDSMLAVV